jgi:predicted transcriptional regulator
MQTAMQVAKQDLHHLSDQASWDVIMYEFHVKQKIETGLKAVDDGRTVSHEEAKNRLLDNAG